MIAEKIDCGVDQGFPSIAGWVVADLLSGEAGDDGGPQVEVGLVCHPDGAELLSETLVASEGGGICLLAGLEAGDGPLEHELIAGGVIGAEVEEVVGGQLERVSFAVGVEIGLGVARGLPMLVALAVHGVVDGVLGDEVGVQRRCLDADGLGQLTHRPPGQTLGSRERPGRLDHGLSGGLCSSLGQRR